MIRWGEVPGWFDFEDVYREAVERAPLRGAHFVEVGILFGRSTLFLAEELARSGKQVRFDAVDTLGYSASELATHVEKYLQVVRPAEVDLARRLLSELGSRSHDEVVRAVLEGSGLGHYVNLVRSDGQSHATTCEDGSLDLVFIDASHEYDDTVSLVEAYLPKVKTGGVLAGHDFTSEHPGVVRAVEDVLPQARSRGSCFYWVKA